MTPAEQLVESYFQRNYRPVFWPQIGDSRGPRELGWPDKVTTFADYREGIRVGLLLGAEVVPGQFLHDVDIDWAEGMPIAMRLLPETGFVFGRASKKVSHCFYLLPEALPSFRYEDIDKTCLLELRGTKVNGDLGLQTMVPPSVWTKENQREELVFVKADNPTYHETNLFRQRVCLSAIGMLLARHLGHNGFGHPVQMAWSGFMIRLGIPIDDLILLGEAIGVACNHTGEPVRNTILSTAQRLADPKQKIQGGPALAKIIGEKGKAVVNLIIGWLGRDRDFIRGKDGGVVKDSQENIRRAIQLMEVELSYDMYAEKILLQESGLKAKMLSDHLLENLWLRLDRESRFRPTWNFFEIVVRNMAHDNEFHPVRDYLNSLIWDGVSRIDRWLEIYGGAEDSEYLRAVSSIVLKAAVKRVFHPGCKYDEMLVLESEQGLDKSSALRALCPTDEWFSDDLPLNVDAKQIIERTLGKWIIEASDLTGGRKADRDHLKSMLSRQIDGPARMAYAHTPVERARQFIIIGTTNNASYLADMTGARRFWPVRVGRFKTEALIQHRDQLWAEAVVREKAGESVRLPRELWDAAGEHQETRRELDAWETAIAGELDKLQIASTGKRQVATNTIWQWLGIEMSRRDRHSAMRISEIMQRLRYFRTKVYVDSKTQAGYQSVETFELPFEK